MHVPRPFAIFGIVVAAAIALAASLFYVFHEPQTTTVSNPTSSTAQSPTAQPVQTPANIPTSPTKQDAALATTSLSNFLFAYPAGAAVMPFVWEGTDYPENLNIAISADGNVFIFTTPAPNGSINTSAKTLDDYRIGYPIDDGYQEVMVASTTDITIYGVRMLRQSYSIGNWTVDDTGHKVLDFTNEADVSGELRYVFFDGKNFIVLTTWGKDVAALDEIAHSIQIRR